VKGVLVVLLGSSMLAGCAVQSQLHVTRIARYDASGELIGYEVRETLTQVTQMKPMESDFHDYAGDNRPPRNWPPRR